MNIDIKGAATEKRERLNLNPIWLWIRSRMLEGSWPGGPDVGAWPTSGFRVMRGWGAVRRSDWGYSATDDWPPVEPQGLEALARKHRKNRYLRIRSAADCVKALASGMCVVSASFEIMSKDWFEAPNGVIPLPTEGVHPDAGHCVAVLSVDVEGRWFAFPNSWGEQWGDRGWGYMSADYFDRYLTDAWYIDGFIDTQPHHENENGIQFLDWMYYDVFGRPILGFEAYDFDNDERIAWWFAVDAKLVLEVEEFFVMPAFRRQGYGTTLIRKLLEIKKALNRDVVLWIPHPDWNEVQRPITEDFLQDFRFSFGNSEHRWAAARATLGVAPPPPTSGPFSQKVPMPPRFTGKTD